MFAYLCELIEDLTGEKHSLGEKRAMLWLLFKNNFMVLIIG